MAVGSSLPAPQEQHKLAALFSNGSSTGAARSGPSVAAPAGNGNGGTCAAAAAASAGGGGGGFSFGFKL